MKYAIISDIHSDYRSLSIALDDISKQNIDKIFCLGDMIGYLNEPENVVQRIISEKIPCVAGNHEKAFFSTRAFNMMNPFARGSLGKNSRTLSDESIKFLENLPLNHSENNILFVHGSPPDSYYHYINHMSEIEILQVSKMYQEKIAFCGHTHRNAIIEIHNNSIKRDPEINTLTKYILDDDKRYIINVGSISLPRGNNNPGKTYAIYDRSENFVKFVLLD